MSLVWRALALMLATGASLVGALWNGYPLVFYDTGDYVAMSFTYTPVTYRTIPYAIFLAVTSLATSLWWPALAQAGLTAWIIHETMVAFGVARPWLVALMAIVLATATSLPWYAGQIMPDAFAALMVLALAVLFVDTGALSAARRAILTFVVFAGAMAHLSHLALGLGLFALAAAWIAFADTWRAALLRLLPAGLALAAALLALPALNWSLTGRAFYSESGPVFLLARLMQDGLAQRHLDRACPTSGYKLCNFRDALPTSASDLLWGRDSALVELGGWHGLRAEAASIVRASIVEEPLANIRAAAGNGVSQFVSFAAGSGLYNQWQTSQEMVAKYLPGDIAAYRDSRQQRDRLAFAPLNAYQVPIAAVALALVPLLAGYSFISGRASLAGLGALLLAALLGNAAICGALSGPSDRYQSRVVWLAVFYLGLVLAERFSGQNTSRPSRLEGISRHGGQTISSR